MTLLTSPRQAPLILCIVAISQAMTISLNAAEPDYAVSKSAGETRLLREGTRLVDHAGVLRLADGRVSFATHDGYVLAGLENLAAERVAFHLRENPKPMIWSVNGIVTEHQGKNYLLITRALVKSSIDEKQAP